MHHVDTCKTRNAHAYPELKYWIFEVRKDQDWFVRSFLISIPFNQIVNYYVWMAFTWGEVVFQLLITMTLSESTCRNETMEPWNAFNKRRCSGCSWSVCLIKGRGLQWMWFHQSKMHIIAGIVSYNQSFIWIVPAIVGLLHSPEGCIWIVYFLCFQTSTFVKCYYLIS